MDPGIVVEAGYAVPAWSPNGEWIAVGWWGHTRYIPFGIYLIRPDGSDFHRLPGVDSSRAIIDLSWSPDSQWLVFAASVPFVRYDIFKIKVDGDSLTQLTNSGNDYACTWSPTDSLIAYRESPPSPSGIWLMDKFGNGKRMLVSQSSFPSFFSEDSLVFVTNINADSGRMAIISARDGSERTVLSWKKGAPYTRYYDPVVSSVSKEIVLSIDERIWKLKTDGSDLRKLSDDHVDFPWWSPDGEWIVYDKRESNPYGGTIWIMDSAGLNARLLLDWSKFFGSDSKEK
ncbi:MAG: PD40 domain-containing protein [bacterium]